MTTRGAKMLLITILVNIVLIAILNNRYYLVSYSIVTNSSEIYIF
jgi:hypothetical protein